MAATFGWREFNGVASTGTPTNANMGSVNMRNLTPATYPITAGENSFEKWLYANFSGSFTTVSNLKFWKSAGTTPDEKIMANCLQTATVAPKATTSTIAIASVLTSEPAYSNVGINGATVAYSTASDTAYIVLQEQIDSGKGAGATSTKTFTFQYDET